MINILSRSITIVTLSATLVVCPVATVVAGAEVTFSFVNNSPYTIDNIYVSPGSVDNWKEEDVVEDGLLSPGEWMYVTVDDGREDCIYDFKLVLEDGSELSAMGAYVCSGESYSFVAQ